MLSFARLSKLINPNALFSHRAWRPSMELIAILPDDMDKLACSGSNLNALPLPVEGRFCRLSFSFLLCSTFLP